MRLRFPANIRIEEILHQQTRNPYRIPPMVIEDANDAPQLEQTELAEHTHDELQLGTIILKVQSETNVDGFSWDDIDQGRLSYRSEFDDSSDEDYKQSEESEDGEESAGSFIPSDFLVDDDDVLGEETSKDMGGTNNYELCAIGGWCDDVITDEDDALKICPNILKKIQKSQDASRSCFSIYSGEEEYQIQYVNGFGVLDQFVVKLRDKSCTCGFFQLRGYPCCHAACAIAQGRHKIQDYVASNFFKDEYLKGYSYMIHAVPGVVDYCKSTCEPLRPPPIKRKRGRPKKNRKKDPDEGKSVSIRRGLTHTCSRCLEVGHNKATCSKPVHPKSKFYKRSEGVGNGDEIGHQSTQASSSAFAPRKRKKSKNLRPTQNSATGEAHGSVFGDFNAAEMYTGGPRAATLASSIERSGNATARAAISSTKSVVAAHATCEATQSTASARAECFEFKN